MAPIDVSVARLWVGDRGGPSFLPTGAPVLSWSVGTQIPDWEQASAVLELRLGATTASHRVDGHASLRVAWPFLPLGAHERAAVRVSVVGTDGSRSGPSAWLDLVTGPLGADDWRGELIGATQARPELATVRVRTVVDVPPGLASATLSATAHGLYQAVLGGRVVGDEVMTPGWTAYDRRLPFQTFDVTDLLVPGSRTVLGATVAEGWYGERYGFMGVATQRWTGPPSFAAQLRMVDADGRVTTVATDASWQASVAGPVTSAGIYQGESYDARLADAALEDPDVALPHGAPAVVVPGDRARLVPAVSPPVRTHEELAVQQVLTSPSGATILDFGQNLVGWLRLRVAGPAGTTVTLRHAEVLEHGELGTRPLRRAAATDHFTLAGTGVEEYAPRFTFHGFRYAELERLAR